VSDGDARPRLNPEWHLANPMPRKATLAQRIDWHEAHSASCACRPPPAGIQAELERRKQAKA
jgi:hypothetical protein